MPIHPDLARLYPPDWPEISDRIRFGRAGGRCEQCCRPHGSLVICLPDGRWYDVDAGAWRSSSGSVLRQPVLEELLLLRTTRVVLATAHLDHDPTNGADENLAALCGRCHLLHDLPHHLASRWLRFRMRWALGDLLAGAYPVTRFPLNS